MSARIGVALLLACALRGATAQAQSERVRGRVVDDGGAPVPQATVIVTRTADRQFRDARTGADGTFSVDFADRSGDYSVRASAAGFRPVTAHAVVPAGAAEVVVELRLTRGGPQQLSAIHVRARRGAPRPDRPAVNAGVGVGAAETVAIPQAAAQRLGPDAAGDLAAIAAMTSSVAPVTGGVSVFGLPPTQNATTLNGLAFAGAEIPRDVRASVRVSASSYDPANGWFSGARTNVQLAPGGLFSSRTVRVTGDAPSLQAGDPQARQLGQRFANVSGSLAGDGQLVADRYAYNYGLQLTRRTTDLASLDRAGPTVLSTLGLSPDSALVLRALLGGLGVPLGAPRTFTAQSATFLGRVDRAPYDWSTLTPATTTVGLTAYGRVARTDAATATPLSVAAHAGTSDQMSAALQAELSHYTRANALETLRTGVSVSRSGSSPYVALPEGRVQIQSGDAGVGATNTVAQFGGNAAQGGSTRALTWETQGELQLFTSAAAAHRITLTADARLDAVRQETARNLLGTVTYATLADLAANTPSSFSRTLAEPAREGGEWNAFAAVSDQWRVGPGLQLLYGARLEGSAFAQRPPLNETVARTFGSRNDAAPSHLHASPRLGFTWTLPARGVLGQSVVRGGAGEFRSLLDPALVAGAAGATGLPGAMTQVSCSGAAVPAAAWSAWLADPASIPTQCAGGAGSLADPAPLVRLVGARYAPATSWRGNVGWSSSVKGHVFGVDAALSRNVAQPGTVDLNFAGAAPWTTSDEGRPVFASEASIVAATGVVSPVTARRSASFGRVVESVSDLTSTSRQLTLTFRPKPAPPPARIGDFTLGYTLSSVRAAQRGFDASTFGDPRALEETRGDLDARHRFTVQGVLRPARGFFLFVFGRLQSGTPYTPMVGADVNGDALANDRAFVFDPGRTGDSALASGMRALLASADSRARGCLVAQRGRAGGAGRNSCEGPWTAALNANLRIDGDRFHLPRVQLFVDFQNPLAGLDQLLHGADRMRGWGSAATPDPVLYRVRGFDPAANRFLYDVNPRFGRSLPNGIGNARAPFRLTLDVAIDIGRSFPAQQLDRWLGTGARKSGAPLDVDALTRRLARNVPDPYAALIVQADSLLLTGAQTAALTAAQQRVHQRADSAWRALATYLAALPDRYDAADASARIDKVIGEVWEITRQDVRATLGAVLDPVQIATLTGWAGQLWRAQGPVRMRIYGG